VPSSWSMARWQAPARSAQPSTSSRMRRSMPTSARARCSRRLARRYLAGRRRRTSSRSMRVRCASAQTNALPTARAYRWPRIRPSTSQARRRRSRRFTVWGLSSLVAGDSRWAARGSIPGSRERWPAAVRLPRRAAASSHCWATRRAGRASSKRSTAHCGSSAIVVEARLSQAGRCPGIATSLLRLR